MKTCTFFGHRDAPTNYTYELKNILIDLVENERVDMFLVGNNGKFDSMVLSVLKEFSAVYKHIAYSVVLSEMPGAKVSDEYTDYDCEHTMYPFILETTPPRFAIDARNKWMVQQADYVVTYVVKSYGGAAKFKEYAEKKGKKVINLADAM